MDDGTYREEPMHRVLERTFPFMYDGLSRPSRFEIPSRRRPWKAVVLFALLGLATWATGPAMVGAGTRMQIALPVGPLPPRSGLRMTMVMTWVQGNGYRPVRITLAPVRSGPAVADREVLVELYPSARPSSRGLSVSQYITLPEGATEITETVLVPQNQRWGNIRIDVWENGRKLKDLSMEGFGTGARQEWTEGIPKILILDSDAPPRHLRDVFVQTAGASGTDLASRNLPDVRGLANFLPNQFNVSVDAQIRDTDVLSHVSQLDHLELIPPRGAPQSWLGYTCLDLVFISHADLIVMVTDEPARWQALRRWVTSGGTMCVFGMGDQFQRLVDLENQCGLSPLEESAGTRRGWQVPDKNQYAQTIPVLSTFRQNLRQNLRTGRVFRNPSGQLIAGQPAQPTQPTKPATSYSGAHFLSRPWALGTLVAFDDEEIFPGNDQQWQYLLNSLGTRRWMWYQRHGVSLRRENKDFWNFLIPGVGEAPVGAFRILITLFIVVIGPVNYVLLRRWRRLNWLLVTVPAGAMVVTMGLFGYALLSDGLGARVRIRSFTHIDQNLGQAVSWSRQSYYAGLAPSEGLVFPKDMAVYSLVQFPPTEYSRGTQRSQRLHWDDQQRLQHGFISSRATSQLITVRARSTSARLIVSEPREKNAAPVAENRLGAAIQLLVLRDKQGNYFRARDIPLGGKSPLSAATVQEIRQELSRVYSQHRISLPEGFDPEDHRGAVSFMTPYRSNYWGNDASLPAPTALTSILEQNLSRLLMYRPDHRDFVPGHYMALVGRMPEVSLGIPAAREVASFHVVTGTW